MKLTTSLAVFALVISTGCVENPADSKPAAKVEAPAKAGAPAPAAAAAAAAAGAPAAGVPAAAAAAAPAGGLALTGDIIFVGSKVSGNHACKFTDWTGSAKLDGEDVTKAALSFTVQTKGIAADYEAPTKWSVKLEKHLRSDDFFDSEAHPTATFSSSAIVAKAGEGTTHEITGTLTIKGIEKVVTFPATIAVEAGNFKAKAEFSINRKDFQIMYEGKPDNLIRDDVLLKLNFKS